MPLLPIMHHANWQHPRIHLKLSTRMLKYFSLVFFVLIWFPFFNHSLKTDLYCFQHMEIYQDMIGQSGFAVENRIIKAINAILSGRGCSLNTTQANRDYLLQLSSYCNNHIIFKYFAIILTEMPMCHGLEMGFSAKEVISSQKIPVDCFIRMYRRLTANSIQLASLKKRVFKRTELFQVRS